MKEGPTFYQDDSAKILIDKKKMAIRGPHGLGKTMLASLLIHWFALTRDGEEDWKIVTTASAWRQLTKYLWPEIHKWARRLRWDKIGRPKYDLRTELQVQSLRLTTGEAFAVASDDHTTIEGAHAEHLFYLFDEAKAIPSATWDAAEGAFSGAGGNSPREALALAISTPGEPVGRFYDIQQRKPGYEDWHTKHVTLDDAIKSGRITQEWADQRKKQWAGAPALYANRVLGEFAANDEKGVVPLAWLELAYDRYDEWREAGKPGKGKLIALGADIAEGGGNATVLAPLYEVQSEICDLAFEEFREFDHIGEKETSTMATCGRIVGIVGKTGAKVVVDAVGVGAGVSHRLAEQKINVMPFKGGVTSDRRDLTGEFSFKNLNAAAWYGLRDLLSPESKKKIAIPRHDKLTGDLTTRHYQIRSDGVVILESKDDYKKRVTSDSDSDTISDSPDYGDAAAMATYGIGHAVAGGALLEGDSSTIRRGIFMNR